jgi:hypothetical protein
MGSCEQVGTSADLERLYWVLLRCASSETLRLVESLNEFGIKAWSPIGQKRGRKPRSRSYYDKTFPLTSSYVFAADSELLDLEMLSSRPLKGMPIFSVFYHAGIVPKIKDCQLNSLRAEEQRLKDAYRLEVEKGLRRKKFDRKAAVKFTDGAFGGLVGEVVEHTGTFALVSVDGFALPIKVSEALLENN